MTTTLVRHLNAGDRLSFDGGRIVLTMENRTGRRTTLRMRLDESVKVDKPEKSDPPCNIRSIFRPSSDGEN
jgi:hypothetical protein